MDQERDTSEALSQDISQGIQAQQRRAIRKSYQRKKRMAKAKKAAQTATKTAKTAVAAETIGTTVVTKSPVVIFWVVVLFILLFWVFSMVQAVMLLASGGANGIVGVASTYTTDKAVMLAVDGTYSAMELALQGTIDSIETTYPDYDEYVYNLDPIGHSSHGLAAYLSAKYINYTNINVDADLATLYPLQYDLTITTSTETRTRPSEDDEDVDEEYTVSILTVTLKNYGLEQGAIQLLTPEQLELYYLYLNNQGGDPLLFGGGSTSGVPDTDLSGVTFVDGERVGNETIVYTAKTQLGDINNGGQKFWSWYGFGSREPWCACFVSWCLAQAGYTEPVFSYCPTGITYFVNNGRWATRGYSDIAPGDVIFFDWENDGISDHVGIVAGTDGSRVYTVEGNAGDAVHVRDYAVNSNVIMGYGLM